MAGHLSAFLAALCVVISTKSLQQPPPSSASLPAELAYETFCKKEEAVRKRLFRAATPEQKSILTRRQIERWREANLSRLSKTQLTTLQELWTMANPAMFEATEVGRRALEGFERRADAAFSGREMDALGPYGPCIAKEQIGQALAAYAAGDPGAIQRWLATPRAMAGLANAGVLVAGNAAVPAGIKLAFLLDLAMAVPAPFVPPLLRTGRALLLDDRVVDPRVERLCHQAALGVAQHVEQFWLQQEWIDATAARVKEAERRGVHLNPRLRLARGVAAAGLCCWERVPGAAIQHAGRRVVRGPVTLDAALVLFEQAAADPVLAAEARIRGAVLLQSAGRYTEALSWFDRVPPEDDPALGYVRHLTHARILDVLQRPGDAAVSYRRALRFDPNAQVAGIGLAAALLRSGRSAEAGAAAANAGRLPPGGGGHGRTFERGDARFVRGWIAEIRRASS